MSNQDFEKRLQKAKSATVNGQWYTPPPDNWLKRVKWSVRDAMLLFSGLNPYQDDIAWESEGVLVHLRHVERIGFELCDPSTYARMSRKGLEQEISRIRREAKDKLNEAPRNLPYHMYSLNTWKDTEAESVCKKWLAFYDESESLLTSFLGKWFESRNEELDYKLPPKTFLEWATEQGLTDKIPWWLEAVETGLAGDAKHFEGQLTLPSLITVKSAIKEGQLDKYDLFREAEKGPNNLELLVYVDFKDIVGHVAVPDNSLEVGCYLPLPSYSFARLIEKGDANIDSFDFPITYCPTTAGLLILRQIISQSPSMKIKARVPYQIRLNQEKIWVVRQQAEKFYKKAPEAVPHTIIQGATADAGQKNVATANQIDEQEYLYENYFHSTGDHWEIRFNGEKGTVRKKKPFLFLLKYLDKPDVPLRSDDIFREVQSDLGKSAQRCSNEGYEDDKSDIVEKDSDSGMSIVMTAALKKDETSVLTREQKNSYEEDTKALIDQIELTKRNKDIEKAEGLERTLERVIEQLKKEFDATMDPSTGKINHYNRVAKGRNFAAEETRRNLRRAVEHLKESQREVQINLAEHIMEFLIKKKFIYQPPKDFPKWHISY